MTDENPKVSDETQVEELPTPNIGANASSTSTDADAIVSKVREALQEDIERAIQSTKDKRFQRLEDSADLLARLKAAGVEVPDSMVTDMRIEQLEKQLSEKPAARDEQGSSSSANALADAMAVMAKYQVETNTPEFIALLKKNYPSRDAFDNAVLRHALDNKVAPSQPASQAGYAVAPATGGAQTPNVEAMTQEYQNKMLAARGNKTLATQIKESYRNKGVPVDDVMFGV